MTAEKINNILENLKHEEYDYFKWLLIQGLGEGFLAIPASKLPKGASFNDTVDAMLGSFGYRRALEATRIILVKIPREDLVESLSQRDFPMPVLEIETITQYQSQLQSNLHDRVKETVERTTKWKNKKLLDEIYTNLYIIDGSDGRVNTLHEFRRVEKTSRTNVGNQKSLNLSDIFKDPSGKDISIRTVLTNGIAGIGKSFLVQKFILDWCERRSNQDVHLVFPFTFQKLNLLKEQKLTLAKLIHRGIRETKFIREEYLNDIFTDLQASGNTNYGKSNYKLLFVLDGLDESRLQLHCSCSKKQSEDIDVTEVTSVDVLLTNLIKGNLLPSARVWITTRPAAASQIHADFVDMVMEVKGFNNLQKEQYFKNRFPDVEQAEKIIAYVKTSRTLYIMCHIPVFCWIMATVLKSILENKEALPKTLTEMYTYFLMYQIAQSGERCDTQRSIECIWFLAKLAFNKMQHGNVIFYEKDLKQSGIDVREVSLYSGVFTEVFEEEEDEDEDGGKMFCFVHLSVQEYLAAVYVVVSFINHNKNIMLGLSGFLRRLLLLFKGTSITDVHEIAIDTSIKSPNGHWDLFLRFLLGLSLKTNQKLLKGLLKERANVSQASQQTVQYIKEKLSKNSLSPEASINLFHCLKELKDDSLVSEIQQYLSTGSLSGRELSPAYWSAVAFVLQTSERQPDVFDLKKYSDSEEPFLMLLPAFEGVSTYLLSSCSLSWRSCEALSSILESQSCSLTELDLSNNDLQDSGLKLLSNGLRSPHCKLQTLRLSGCMITGRGCAYLASALTDNPLHLRELDLSYNDPGHTVVTLLSAGRDNPDWRLDTLKLDPVGEQFIRPGLRKYFCKLALDPNTANTNLQLSDSDRKVTMVFEQQQQRLLNCPERFVCWQLLCRNGLTCRCYWEVEWEGAVDIAVAYRGSGKNCRFGRNDRSWSLSCSDLLGNFIYHNNRKTTLSPSLDSNRVGVYVDYLAGILSFYVVDSDKLIHLHTINTTFTETLYPAFGFGCVPIESSVFLCEL